MYIAEPETADEDIAKLNEAIQQLIEKKAEQSSKLTIWDGANLLIRFRKRREGHYVLFEIEGSGQEIAELERRMRVNDVIMRYITVRVDEERKTAAEINRQTRKPSKSSPKCFRSNFRQESQTEECPG